MKEAKRSVNSLISNYVKESTDDEINRDLYRIKKELEEDTEKLINKTDLFEQLLTEAALRKILSNDR